jgi:hypothetical protein
MLKTWTGHTIRIEKDAGITWRTPKGRATGWGNPYALADMLRVAKGKYKLDLSRTPLKLRNLVSSRELTNCYVLSRELSSLSNEEWNSLVVHPEKPAAFAQVLLFDPETVETRRTLCGFPVRVLLRLTSEGVWDWVPMGISRFLATEFGL